MKQDWVWKKTPVPLKQIQEVEKVLGCELAADLRCFIQECNGASPKNKYFKLAEGDILVFDSAINILDEGIDGSFFITMKNLEGQFPAKTFPIGFDPFGNIFYVIACKNQSPVFFWKHDNAVEDIPLSNSLQSFLEALYGD